MRLVLALALLPSIVACGGGGEDSSVSGVFPSSAFLGRKVRVEISGDVTSWKDGAKVDFGAGVTVNSVSVASPTALFADITVADDAAPGLRDVTVDSGGKFTLKQAFQLESAITLKFSGMTAQGSIATFAINNHDFDTPFDDTSTGDGFFTPIEYTNLSIESAPGVRMQVNSVTPYAITGLAFFDLDATSGPVVVDSGIDADMVKSNLGETLAVTARTATPLTANTAATGTVTKAFDSALYEFTASSAPGLVQFTATATGQAASPGVVILPASGKFEDLLAYSAKKSLVQLQSNKYYAVYFDIDGGYGYNYSVKASSGMLTTVAENDTANNTSANAPVIAPMSLVNNATLASATDADWYAINITAADVGKKIRCMTTGNDPQTDVAIQAFKPPTSGTAPEAMNATPLDKDYHEDFTSPTVSAAGKYWVKITASDYFSPSHNAYVAAIWLE